MVCLKGKWKKKWLSNILIDYQILSVQICGFAQSSLRSFFRAGLAGAGHRHTTRGHKEKGDGGERRDEGGSSIIIIFITGYSFYSVFDFRTVCFVDLISGTSMFILRLGIRVVLFIFILILFLFCAYD